MLTNPLNNFTVVCTMSWVSKYVSYYNKPMEGIVVLHISKNLLLVKAFQQVIQSLQMIISLDLSGKQIASFEESRQLKIIHLCLSASVIAYTSDTVVKAYIFSCWMN